MFGLTLRSQDWEIRAQFENYKVKLLCDVSFLCLQMTSSIILSSTKNVV